MAKPFTPPLIYTDGYYIYLEWTNHVQKIPCDQWPIPSKIRGLLPHIASSPGHVTGGSNIATKTLESKRKKIIAREGRRRIAATLTDAELQSAMDILRRFRK
jgi:hypothetical protein